MLQNDAFYMSLDWSGLKKRMSVTAPIVVLMIRAMFEDKVTARRGNV